jgi:hypothetical protein
MHKTDGMTIKYWKSQSVATAIIAVLIVIIFVLPITLCYILLLFVGGRKAYAGCIAILFIFTLMFITFVIVFSKAKRQEVLAATAA